jgi:thymidylate synthase
MVPDELIGNLGDCHIYLNQIEGVKGQIGREPLELPTLKLPKTDAFWDGFDVGLFGHLEPSDFQIEGYKSHPSIKIPLSN